MATRRRSPYEKFWTQYERTAVELLFVDEPSERQLKRWSELERRRIHWDEHEQEPEACPWCQRYPIG